MRNVRQVHSQLIPHVGSSGSSVTLVVEPAVSLVIGYSRNACVARYAGTT
jgi:hypothetical protein